MRILVTGASGFLGIALCRNLESCGHEVVQLNSRICDLRRSDSLETFNDAKYDQIYHLAAWTQAGDFCLSHPGEQWVINQAINTHVLSWWQRSQPQAKLICMGTSCSYDPNLDHIETNYLVGQPTASLFTYAMTKRMLYVGCQAMHRQYGLNYLHLVPSTLYGPNYHNDGRQMHFIFDLIRKIVRGKVFGEPVVLWGDGYQRRELIYAEDFARLVVKLSESCHNDLVNVASGQAHTIREFARMICEIVSFDFDQIQFDPERYVGAKSKVLVTDKLKQLVPDLSLTDLGQGLTRTVEWFYDQFIGSKVGKRNLAMPVLMGSKGSE